MITNFCSRLLLLMAIICQYHPETSNKIPKFQLTHRYPPPPPPRSTVIYLFIASHSEPDDVDIASRLARHALLVRTLNSFHRIPAGRASRRLDGRHRVHAKRLPHPSSSPFRRAERLPPGHEHGHRQQQRLRCRSQQVAVQARLAIVGPRPDAVPPQPGRDRQVVIVIVTGQRRPSRTHVSAAAAERARCGRPAAAAWHACRPPLRRRGAAIRAAECRGEDGARSVRAARAQPWG